MRVFIYAIRLILYCVIIMPWGILLSLVMSLFIPVVAFMNWIIEGHPYWGSVTGTIFEPAAEAIGGIPRWSY